MQPEDYQMKIRIEDSAAIEAALSEANGKANAHTIRSADEVREIAERAEKYLSDTRLNAAFRVGTTVTFRPEGPGKQYAKRGRYVTTTRITLERRKTQYRTPDREYRTGWFLVGVERVDMHAESSIEFDVTITKEIAEKIMQTALSPFKVAA